MAPRPRGPAPPHKPALSMRASVHYRATHEEQYSGEPSPRRSAAGGQSSSGGADLPVGEVLVRRYRRDSALPARRTRGILLLGFGAPHVEAIAAVAGAAAGQGRLSADGVR